MIRHPGFLLLIGLATASAGNPRLDFAFGILAETRGDEDGAGRLFEAARLADATALPLVERAVATRQATGDRAGAAKLYRDLATARKDELRIQLSYADFLGSSGREDSLARKLASEVLEATLLKNPGHPDIVRRLFTLAEDRPERRMELLGMLSKDDPRSVLLFASLFKGMPESSTAESQLTLDAHFLRAMEAHPENRGLARAASDHFLRTERPGKAIELLQSHAKASPSSLDLRTRLGVQLFAAKRDDEGEAALKEVLEIHPRQALAHQSLAKFYRLRDRLDAARHHAGELLKIRGGSASEFLDLSDEWLGANEPRQARLLLERAVFDYPEDAALASKLAIASRRDPETRQRASRLFREAEAVQAEGTASPEFLVESAESLIAEGQGKAAEERLRAAIKGYPAGAKKETASALRRLAALWESEKRNPDAAKALRQRADSLDR